MNNLKAHFRDLVDACGGTKRAANLTHFHASHISEAMAPHTDRQPRLDHVAILEADCGSPIVTSALADALGLDVVPRAAVAVELSPFARLAKVVKESADVSVALADAGADGKLTAVERNTIAREAREAIAELHALIADMERPQVKAVSK